MQLNLFDWHVIATGQGFAKLARLEFDEARKKFAEALVVMPAYPEAQSGMKDLDYWEQVFEETSSEASPAAARRFWRMFKGFSFAETPHHHSLRQHLLTHLTTLLPAQPTYYDPPDLCQGYLYLQRGDYRQAEEYLRLLIEDQYDQALIHLFLAEALWLQGRKELAGPHYATALLLDPPACINREISNHALIEVIEEHGVDLAPIYAFFSGVLPLVELYDAPLPGKPVHTLYEMIRQAELTRRCGAHQQMVNARNELKQANTPVFKDYLSYVREKSPVK